MFGGNDKLICLFSCRSSEGFTVRPLVVVLFLLFKLPARLNPESKVLQAQLLNTSLKVRLHSSSIVFLFFFMCVRCSYFKDALHGGYEIKPSPVCVLYRQKMFLGETGCHETTRPL